MSSFRADNSSRKKKNKHFEENHLENFYGYIEISIGYIEIYFYTILTLQSTCKTKKFFVSCGIRGHIFEIVDRCFTLNGTRQKIMTCSRLLKTGCNDVVRPYCS